MLDNMPIIITGGSYNDERGTVTFINDFDMKLVKRFYRIRHPHILIERGWRGHRIEQRWFHVYAGAFEVKLVQIDNWVEPSKFLPLTTFLLDANDDSVLHIPVGFASCIKATVAGSEMIIFTDYPITHAKNDDYLFPLDYFEVKKN